MKKTNLNLKNVARQVSTETMFHSTNKHNLDKIKQEGLKINSDHGYSIGSRSILVSIYGVVPVFLSFEPYKYNGKDAIVFSVNVSGINLVADIPSLYDLGAQYSENEQGMWFEAGKEPKFLAPYLNDGEVLFDDLLNSNSLVCAAAIKDTQTAASMEDISKNRLRVQNGRLK